MNLTVIHWTWPLLEWLAAFRGAKTTDEFWDNLCNGVESVRIFAPQELRDSIASSDVAAQPRYVHARAILDDIEYFDAEFFGMTAREAEVTNPQQRMFLECAWEALESAGYSPGACLLEVGVYGGSSANAYMDLLRTTCAIDALGDVRARIGNDKDHLTTFVSYKLNLTGPSINIQTGCSTSLVAVHIACQALICGECDIAIAGAASIDVSHGAPHLYEEGSILSPDGHCRAFDASAAGTVGGSGVGVVVLKRLADATTDRDAIHAIIKGSAVNNDGALKMGYTAPSIVGQTRVIREALDIAHIDPLSITYVEAHGTGTPLGDPIEIEALSKAIRGNSAGAPPCAIGSVKTNIGHLDAAAGIAGLIKAIYAVEHGVLPASLHYKNPNPKLDLERYGLYVNSQRANWDTGDAPRRAGVSAFGIGGTNAHVILEEPPPHFTTSPGSTWEVLSLSAATETSLRSYAGLIAKHLTKNKTLSLNDLAYSLHVGRKAMGHRLTIVTRDLDDAVAALKSLDTRATITTVNPGHQTIVFMFPGQGSQYPRMAHDLYRANATFREQLDLCCHLFEELGGINVHPVLFPPASKAQEAAQELNNTAHCQAALFAVEYALARMWMNWGVTPEAMIGHSLGEYVAACIADVWSIEDAIQLIATRGRLMSELPCGRMLAVGLAEADLAPLLPAELSLAAVNGPDSCVVAGRAKEVEHFRGSLGSGIHCHELSTSHAFHSEMMEPILGEFRREVERVVKRRPRIPFISNVTGQWILDEQAQDPNYWARHLRSTVRFLDGAEELAREPATIYLEVGPGQGLATLISAALLNEPTVIPSLGSRHDQRNDLETIAIALARLWSAGAPVNWHRVYEGESRNRLRLPTHPFERRRSWPKAEAKLEYDARDSRKVNPPATDHGLERAESKRLERVVSNQLRLIAKQLDLLKRDKPD